MDMNAKKKILIIPTILFFLLALSGCGKKENVNLSQQAKEICGEWAYIHEKGETVAEFRSDGTAVYEGEKYTFDCDDSYVYLTDKNEQTTKLRYQMDSDGIYLYKNTVYTYTGDKEPEGIVGRWECEEMKWSFEFTEEGTFLEDGYFPGNYTVNEEDSSVKLIYGDKFEDTVFYYSLEDDRLIMEYPWKMVTTVTQ